MKAPTIKDVSRQAGVSTATVSRVINRLGLVDRDTERRVVAAIEALGYRRNVHWERLSRKSSRMVCFLLGNRPMPSSMHVRMLMGRRPVRVLHPAVCVGPLVELRGGGQGGRQAEEENRRAEGQTSHDVVLVKG